MTVWRKDEQDISGPWGWGLGVGEGDLRCPGMCFAVQSGSSLPSVSFFLSLSLSVRCHVVCHSVCLSQTLMWF